MSIGRFWCVLLSVLIIVGCGCLKLMCFMLRCVVRFGVFVSSFLIGNLCGYMKCWFGCFGLVKFGFSRNSIL